MTTAKNNISKQILSILLCLCMVIGMMPMTSLTVHAADEVVYSAAYSGTPVTPAQITASNYAKYGFAADNYSSYIDYYAISNANELYGFATLVNGGNTSANAVLTANILVNKDVIVNYALNGTPTYSWTPIGSYKKMYSGTFDGNGKIISGLYIDADSANYQGLIGYMSDGTVKNVTVKDSYFEGGLYVGAIVGYSTGTCNITNCHNDNSIVFSNGDGNGYSNAGGILGRADKVTSLCIQNCTNSGAVSGLQYIGGIVGYYSKKASTDTTFKIDNCINRGTVTSTRTGNAGGILGFSFSALQILNCKNYGKVTFKEGTESGYMGGIAGQLYQGVVEVKHCYNEGEISGVNRIAGIVGSGGSSIIESCENKGTIIGTGSPVGGITGSGGVITDCVNSGAVTGEWYVGGITGSGAKISNSKNTGNVTSNTYGAGGITGYVYTSGAVTMENCQNEGNVKGVYYVGGVVGYHYSGSVTYTNCSNIGNIEGTSYGVGGVFGYLGGGTANGCYNAGNVICTGTYTNEYGVGGVVGAVSSALLENCYNTGNVFGNGNDYIGGVVGNYYRNGKTSIKKSYNIGSVTGGNYVGGVVGNYEQFTGYPIENCYNIGSVTGTSYVGGVAGYVYAAKNLTTSYNVGMVSGTKYFGGVIGNNAVVANCYYLDTSVTSPTSSRGISLTAAQMTGDSDWQTNYSGFDTTTPVWSKDTNTTTRQYLPRLTSYSPYLSSGHTHVWSYKLDGTDTIVATCTNADGDCPNTNGGYLSISAPADCGYTGSAVEAKVINALISGADTPTIVYTAAEGSVLTDGKPVMLGTYTATITFDGKTISTTYKICEGTPIVTKPRNISNLVYNGEKQTLITAGSAVNGQMLYSLSKNGEYSTELPKATEAGSYTVWYKVVGDEYFNDIEPTYIGATIGYHIVLDADGITENVIKSNNSTSYRLPTTSPFSNVPTGVTWKGFSLTQGGELITAKRITLSANSTTLYAVWEYPNCTVTFNAGEGTGTMESDSTTSGKYTLPENGFTAPEDQFFKAWSVGGTEYKPGDVITVISDTVVTAVWSAHIHAYEYTVNGTTITATCTAEGCDSANGGSMTLKAENAYYTSNGIGATTEGSFTNGATYAITYNNGETTAPSTVGTHTAKLTVSEKGTEKKSVTVEYEISYLPSPSPAYVIGNGYQDGNTYWFKDGAVITISAPDGYEISKTLGSGYGSTPVSFYESDNKVIYLKNDKGEMTDAIRITETISFDKTAPTGKIEIDSRNFWEKFLNKITFGLFFKGERKATVTAEDTDGSGVKSIKYYLADKDLIDGGDASTLETSIGDKWNTYDKEIPLDKNAKYVIYVKIADHVGNVTYINSEGIVLYSDAEVNTNEISYIYKENKDKDVEVTLNGNSVKSVVCGSASLVLSTDYTVNGGTITLKASYLDKLSVGEYTFTVSYRPLGLEYVEAEGNEAPATTTFTVKVVQAEGSVTNVSDISKTYDGTSVTAPNYTSLSTGKATIEYKVKDAEDSTYKETAPSAAGDYVVRITVAEDTNYKATSATKEFSIAEAKLTEVSVAQDGELIYNKQAQTAKVKTTATAVNDQTVTFTYSIEKENIGSYKETVPSFKNAGEHTVYFKASAPNHEDYSDSFTVTIDKQTVTEPNIASKAYTGSKQTADVPESNLYTAVKNEGGTAKGGYDVVLKLNDADNYKWATDNTGKSATATLQFIITETENGWTKKPSIEGWTYGKLANEPTYVAKFGTVSVVYKGTANDGTNWNSVNAPEKAGNYKAAFTVVATANYTGLSEQVDFTIAKATYNMTNAKWDYTDAFTYDGLEKTVSVKGLPEGVRVDSYSGNTATVTGDYTAKVVLNYDSNNYNTPAVTDLTWEIENTWTPTEYAVSEPNNNGWLKEDFIVTAKDGYELSLTNTVEGEWSETLTGAVEGKDSSLTFYLRNKTTGAISLAKTENYKLDKNTEKTGTTGKVYFDERNEWEEFLSAITFGLFFKDEVTIKAEATDKLSEVESVEYYEYKLEDGTALTLEQVQKITEWTKMPEEGVGATVEDAKRFIYYIRITDKAGNVTYLSTNGAEYDTIAPAISGVKDKETYYTTQVVKIEDKNLDIVTVNEKETALENGTLTLAGNEEKTYIITATDKAGNITTVTVTMKETTSVKESIKDITERDVTSPDKEKVQDVIDHVDELLKDEDLTADEKKALEDIKSEAEKLMKVIENLEKAANAPKTGDFNQIWMLFALMFVSGMSILGITVQDKKRR